MLLQELNKLHDRIESEIGPMYHREDEISWIVQITDRGKFEQIIETSGADGHMTAFRSDRPRTVNVAPYLVIDKPYYVLGLNLDHFDDEQKVNERHQAYVELISECHEETDNPYIGAVETFLNEHVPEARNAPQVEEMDSGDMVTFRVDDKFVHELEPIINFWIEREEKRNSEDSELLAECLICEEEKPIAKVHPIGSQLGQAGLISANEDAFESYGLNRSETASLCQLCA
ncbi:MAG: type I-C CRISPR-associated protein Cas8c/Csd1, partial [Candidatus Acetothermia bacterium]